MALHSPKHDKQPLADDGSFCFGCGCWMTAESEFAMSILSLSANENVKENTRGARSEVDSDDRVVAAFCGAACSWQPGKSPPGNCKVLNQALQQRREKTCSHTSCGACDELLHVAFVQQCINIILWNSCKPASAQSVRVIGILKRTGGAQKQSSPEHVEARWPTGHSAK